MMGKTGVRLHRNMRTTKVCVAWSLSPGRTMISQALVAI